MRKQATPTMRSFMNEVPPDRRSQAAAAASEAFVKAYFACSIDAHWGSIDPDFGPDDATAIAEAAAIDAMKSFID